MIIAAQGVEGSFHYQAAKKYFSDNISLTPFETFRGVFQSVATAKADYGVVAVENSLHGSIPHVLDLLEKYANDLVVIGETYLHIHQQLIGLPGTKLSEIKAVYSHPVALAQCEDFFDEKLPQAERVEFHDTAAAVLYVKERGDPALAAVAGVNAASHFGLPILAPDIEDNKENYTRFLVFTRRPHTEKSSNKASLIITTSHQPGALSDVLQIFSRHGANLTKLQSRPIIGSPWRYKFYIDIEATPEDIEHSIAAVRAAGTKVIELGLYRAGRI